MNKLPSASGNPSLRNMNDWPIICVSFTLKRRCQVQSEKGNLCRPLKMGPLGCPEVSVRNYHSTLRTIRKQRRSHLHRGVSPEITQFCTCLVVVSGVRVNIGVRGANTMGGCSAAWTIKVAVVTVCSKLWPVLSGCLIVKATNLISSFRQYKVMITSSFNYQSTKSPYWKTAFLFF
jgi:hypothetical protein